MDVRIDGASIRAALKEDSTSVFELVREAVNRRTLEECEAAFRDAVDAGIENSVRALLLAGVSADQVVSVTHDVWGVPRDAVAHMACSPRC